MIKILRTPEVLTNTPAEVGVLVKKKSALTADVFNKATEVHAWTDGSSIDGCGGYACLLDNGEIISGSGYLTNQAAELMAIELAIHFAPGNCFLVIHSDSAFAIGCIARHFNLSKSPHLQEIQHRIHDDLISRHIRGRFVKVKGHSGDHQNNVVDKEARRQAEQLRYG